MADGLRKGTVIGGVRVGDMLGRGGFGITYVAQDIRTRKLYAMKEYFPSDFATRRPDGTVVARPEFKWQFDFGLKSFVSEANILKTLPRQKGLVRVRGAFEKLGTAYCLMEYIEGDPLDAMIQRIVKAQGAVPEPLIEDLVDAITSALTAVHGKKVIHRDIKPANVMIRRDHQPILIDFGAAQPQGARSRSSAMFTRRYAPIELFPLETGARAGALREGPWSDLFSLSVMLYEMVTLRGPPDAERRLLTRQQTGTDPYVPCAQKLQSAGHGEHYSERLLSLIDFGCALLPEDRPADAAEYARLLSSESAGARRRILSHARFGTAARLGDVNAVRVRSGQTEQGPPGDSGLSAEPRARSPLSRLSRFFRDRRSGQ